jgi:hypothetical protein
MMMTHMEDNRCFGRLKARELTEEETTLVGGGDSDTIHSRWCPNEVYGGGGQEEGCVLCVYT